MQEQLWNQDGGEARPEDLLLEQQLDNPILQVAYFPIPNPDHMIIIIVIVIIILMNIIIMSVIMIMIIIRIQTIICMIPSWDVANWS